MLEELAFDDNLSVHKIAEKWGMSYTNTWHHLEKLGLLKARRERKKLAQDEIMEKIRILYVNEKKSMHEIDEILGIGHGKVQKFLKEKRLTRTARESIKLKHLLNPEIGRRRGLKLRGRKFTTEWRRKLSESKKGKPPWVKGLTKDTDPRVMKISLSKRGDKNPNKRPEMRKHLSQVMKQKWLDPKHFKKMFEAFHKKPNMKEIKLNSLLNKILPNEYKYVGDGTFILGGKCPDFLNVKGKKKLIELYGKFWHRDEDPQERINFFRNYGFETLIVWEQELENEIDLSQKITDFTGGMKHG